MTGLTKVARLVSAIYLGFVFFAIPALGQEDSSPKSKDGPPKPAATVSPVAVAVDNGDSTPSAGIPLDPGTGQITQVGTGLPLFGTTATPLRWGSFSISNFEYIGIHDNFRPTRSVGTPWTDITLFRTGLMFDHYIKKNRIVLQYLPQMAILGGQIHANAGANNAVDFGTQWFLTPRLNLTLKNDFVQVHSNLLIPEKYFASDASTGAVVQNNFLTTNGSFLADTVSATFEYLVSPRTILTVIPLYRYAKATTNQVGYVANGETYEGVVTLGHALTARRSVGVSESYQVLKQSSPTNPSTARFNTTGVYYREQLAKGTWVTGNLGAEHQSYTDLPNAAHWGLGAGFSLAQDFSSKVGLVIAYSRGVAFNNYVSTRLSDRIDVVLGTHLTRRLTLNTGSGYYHELHTNPRTSGKYATGGFDFLIFRNVTGFSIFTYSFQESGSPQLLSGMRRSVFFGIRWQPQILLPK